MLRALAVVLLCLFAGCSAQLRGDGFYACPDDHCPSNMICGLDHVCHTHPVMPMPDMGMPIDAATTPDAFVGPDAFAGPDAGVPCANMTVGTCPGTEQCVVGAWTAPTPSLSCASSIMTTTHADVCTPGNVCMPPDVCILSGGSQHCMRPCGMATDPCGFGEDCHTTTSGAHVCARACGTGGSCMPNLMCSGGYCVPAGW